MGAAPGLSSARCGFAAVSAFFSLQSPTRQVVPQVRRSDRDRSSSTASQRRHRPAFTAYTGRAARPPCRERTSHRACRRSDPRRKGTGRVPRTRGRSVHTTLVGVEQVEQNRHSLVRSHRRAEKEQRSVDLLHLLHPLPSFGRPPHRQTVVDRAPMEDTATHGPTQPVIALGERPAEDRRRHDLRPRRGGAVVEWDRGCSWVGDQCGRRLRAHAGTGVQSRPANGA